MAAESQITLQLTHCNRRSANAAAAVFFQGVVILHYPKVLRATFLSRPNRFVAECSFGSEQVICHVPNTGRCHELFIPGTTVWLCPSENAHRKTAYDLVCVEKHSASSHAPMLINIDSQAPNRVVKEWLSSGSNGFVPARLCPETFFEDSRFDFYLEHDNRGMYIEVKGVTLEQDGTAVFPDAPTARGVKHLNGLIRLARAGIEAQIIFLIQMDGIHTFTPNQRTDPDFADALRLAHNSGVQLKALSCVVTPDSLIPNALIPIIL